MWSLYFFSNEKDYVKVVENFGKPNLAFFGVFDGHGGNDVSQFISEQLPIVFKKNIIILKLICL